MLIARQEDPSTLLQYRLHTISNKVTMHVGIQVHGIRKVIRTTISQGHHHHPFPQRQVEEVVLDHLSFRYHIIDGFHMDSNCRSRPRMATVAAAGLY